MTERPILFSNGSEAMWWMKRNCDRCWKASRRNPANDTYTKSHCAINDEIISAWLDDGRGSHRVADICSKSDCPYIQTERPKYPRKPKFSNQPTLFDT